MIFYCQLISNKQFYFLTLLQDHFTSNLDNCREMRQLQQMFPIIDFRNGRYQGQTKQQLPHGAGCFMDSSFMFCIGEWIAGEIVGKAIIIYPSGRVFCGQIAYRDMQGLCSFELAEDHVQLITFVNSNKRQKDTQKMAAFLPLLKTVLDIDNSDPDNGRVLGQYQYSNRNERQNLDTVSRILKLGRNEQKLYSYRNFLSFYQQHFYKANPKIFQYILSGSRQYFMGLKGQGLGIKIQPNQQLGINMIKAGRVYLIRAMGYFTKQNILKDIGLKMKDNYMKGIIYEQGIFSLPNTVISYQIGKRPINCFVNFHNYIKRSLFYRDKVLQTDHLYKLQSFVWSFNENLRVIETQRVAQQTIQKPNPYQPQQRQIEQAPKRVNNPYRPTGQLTKNPQYNLNIAHDDIYRSASKKRYVPSTILDQYNKSEYIDPNYRKVQDESFKYKDIRRQPYIVKETPYYQDRPYSPKQIKPYYQYDIPYQPRMERISPSRKYAPYQQQQYPASLYPSRRRSPSFKYKRLQNISQYNSPNKYDYAYDNEYPYRYAGRREINQY